MESNYLGRACSVKEDGLQLNIIDESDNKVKVELIFLKDEKKNKEALSSLVAFFTSLYY
ncbi:hypothetical protein [Bacillus salacetis]|uniref:hypothetical protein n=1 Tax=Bacillus salacetis TaxID=2315464 RepID=UPI001443F537|nr:hypothetical protein [Bacillus salacetis]